ncbi:MAG TPA: HD domain-containing phosphohydrolase, partial [Acidimicrobiia bacterium]|nr:HD domain-containing phosphohydrolase [Acidimicrobiia bacterium]
EVRRAAAALHAYEGAPPLAELLIFSALALVAANLGVGLRSGVTVVPTFLVCMAAMIVFADHGSLAGVALVGALSSMVTGDLRRGRWGWVPFNASLSFLAYLAAAATLSVTRAHEVASTPLAVIAMLPTALVYIIAAWALIIVSYQFDGSRRRPRELIGELLPAAADVMPFALLGLLIGRLYIDLGSPLVLVLIFVPIVISREVFQSYNKVTESRDETVQMMIRALESKDHYTAGHAERVAKYATYIGAEMSLGPWRMERLHFAALMHDIGKLVVPNHILNKPGKLTEEEFARMRVHEKVAVQMLSHIDFLRPVAHSGHSDQMRFDADDPDHPIEPYIVMIADAYDAMTSTRSYRKALPQDIAFQELRDKAGVQFHPECV